jgi:hypothetical protein
MTEIAIPQQLKPLIEAFSADRESAKRLIIEAIKSIGTDAEEVFEGEIEQVISLMGTLKPRDLTEALIAAGIIAGHIVGLRLISHNYQEDQAMGLRALRFSNASLNQFVKKRARG